jgi:hypothetical protein
MVITYLFTVLRQDQVPRLRTSNLGLSDACERVRPGIHGLGGE